MHVLLFGMKHCGKGTVGRLLASRRGWRFVDTDEEIERHFAARTHQAASFREIFRQLGPEGFEQMEACVLGELSRQLTAPCVIALGGRTILNPLAQDTLATLGVRVCLEVDVEELLRRIERTGIPAFLDPADPEGSFRRLYQERMPRYRQRADVIVDLDRLGPEAAASAVEDALAARDQSGR